MLCLCRLWHKEFLRAAADLKASKHALHYVQLLPTRFTDARVYNMVVTACIAARDLPAALEAAEHLRASGRQLDTILYTNLITGVSLFSLACNCMTIFSHMSVACILRHVLCQAPDRVIVHVVLRCPMEADIADIQ